MALQYLRAVRLSLQGAGGNFAIESSGLDPSGGLRVMFRVTHAERAFPQNAVIVVYNLSEKSINAFLNKQFANVRLEAGYIGNIDGKGRAAGLSVIFQGEIIQARRVKENPTDTQLILVAKDGAKGINFGTISRTVGAGQTWNDQIQECLKAWKSFGITAGLITNLGAQRLSRPKILHGMIADKLSDICGSTGSAWHVRDGGKLYVVKNSETMPGGDIILNSSTGLIGRVEQTIQGIVAKCLLNPKIRPTVKLRIDEKSINQGEFSPEYLAKNETTFPSLAADGQYKVLYTDEIGDTHGEAWFTIATCLSASGGNVPRGIAPRGIGIPGYQ